MKVRDVYHRTVRWREGTREIVIPKPLFSHLVLGRYYYLNVWINQKWNIEISNGEKPYNNVNGTVLHRQVHTHGGSVAFTIPHEVVETIETHASEELGSVEIFKNEYGNIEFKPMRDTGKKIKDANKRLKISYNMGNSAWAHYLR